MPCLMADTEEDRTSTVVQHGDFTAVYRIGKYQGGIEGNGELLDLTIPGRECQASLVVPRPMERRIVKADAGQTRSGLPVGQDHSQAPRVTRDRLEIYVDAGPLPGFSHNPAHPARCSFVFGPDPIFDTSGDGLRYREIAQELARRPDRNQPEGAFRFGIFPG